MDLLVARIVILPIALATKSAIFCVSVLGLALLASRRSLRPTRVILARSDPPVALQSLKKALTEALKQLQEKSPKELVESRLERLMAYGKFKEATER